MGLRLLRYGPLMKISPKIFILSISDVLFVTLFVYLSLFIGKGLLGDGDTGYHIRAGEYILDTLSIPRKDMFSFHSPAIPWTAHEWLSEVIMSLVHNLAGLTGIVVFFSLVISLTYYVYFKILRKYTNNILLAIIFSLLVITSSQIHWLARPHIFSLLLMVIWYYLMDLFQYKDKNLLYLLPLIMLVWVNLHGGFVAGFMIISVYLAGNLLSIITSACADRHYYKQKVKHLSIITAACLVTSLINPYGYHILLFPFKLVSSKLIIDSVSEFMSPNFHEPGVFKYMLLLMIAFFAWSRKRLNTIEILLVLLFTNMALYSARYIPLFAIITAPIVLRKTETLLNETNNKFIDFLKKRADKFSSIDNSAKGFLWPLAGTAFVLLAVVNGNLHYGFDPKLKPVSAVEFMKKEAISGNMFSSDEFGDYIIYAAWPEYKVFIDGRLDMYGTSKFKEYKEIVSFKSDWEKTLDKYKITWIIFSSDSPLSRHLLQLDKWKLIYADEVTDIFVKNIPEYKYLIEKYKNLKPVVKDKKDES
jgi:hypothetical protein